MTSLRKIALLALLASSACSNQGSSGPSFAFSRPELLEFLCMGRTSDGKYQPIPRSCCAELDPLGEPDVPPSPAPGSAQCVVEESLQQPSLYALVSQSARGEIAAVDLEDKRVIDSDRVIPGATFIDSGGLPVAMVTPREHPRAPGQGPRWTYVASAEQNQIRAIANCRFRTGVVCGPEEQLGKGNAAELARQTRVPLRGTPGDMVLAPAEGPDAALWVTLPDIGWIARIELANDPNQPFAVDASGAPAEPLYFPIAAPGAVEAPQPVAEADAYQAVCGLGTDFVPATYSLPIAPRATQPVATPRPTRVRYDAPSGLLLVSDAAAPVLHAFALGTGGTLTALPALATGVPLRDFVLTPAVPALAPAQPALQTPALPDPAAPTRRYLYGVEEAGAGLVMSFAFEQAGPGAPARLQPLLAPAPDERFADRLRLQAPTTALAVIDTRSRSSYVCGQQGDAELEQQRDALDAMMSSELDEAERQTLERVEARLSISEESGSSQLRGVFVAAAAADGRLTIIDVLDLDLACRARDACAPCSDPVACPAPNLDRAVDEDERNALAVRRHAARRQRVGGIEATISGQVASLFTESCPVASRPALTTDDGRVLVCVPKDPWATYNETWQVRYRGVLPGFPVSSGAFEQPSAPLPGRTSHVPVPQAEQLTLHAPRGVDLCRRGVEVGDVVAVVGPPAERVRECELPTSSSARLLRVLEVFDDGVVVQALAENGQALAEPPERDAMYAELRRCYPEQVGFEIRARDYLVTGTNIASYMHRVVANEQGRCVIDDSKDPRFTVRPQMGEKPPGDEPGEFEFEAEGHYRFENPYVSFTIALRGRNEPRTARDLSVQVRNAASALTVNNTDGRIVDALPVTVRYLPEVGDLFVVDTASQGLRRYDLVPFEWDRSVFR